MSSTLDVSPNLVTLYVYPTSLFSLAFQTSMQVGKGMTAAASKLRGEGVTLHDWSPADRASFRAAAQAAWSDFATTPEAKALLASHVTYLKELGLVD